MLAFLIVVFGGYVAISYLLMIAAYFIYPPTERNDYLRIALAPLTVALTLTDSILYAN